MGVDTFGCLLRPRPPPVVVGEMPHHVIHAFGSKVDASDTDASCHCCITGAGTSAMTTRASLVRSGSTKGALYSPLPLTRKPASRCSV